MRRSRGRWVAETRAAGRELSEHFDFTGRVRERPLLSVGIAAGAGALFGAGSPRAARSLTRRVTRIARRVAWGWILSRLAAEAGDHP